VRIHWALSYFKGGRAVSFAERILQQELWSGKMCFASWSNFMEEFALVFCPENEATTVLMWLKSNRYFQGKWNIETYINEFKDLIDLSGYTDPITIVLKFRRGLNSTTQDRIAESGTDRPLIRLRHHSHVYAEADQRFPTHIGQVMQKATTSHV
jgi:hypothetical protein